MPFELSWLSGAQGRRERVAVALAFLAWLGGNSAGLWRFQGWEVWRWGEKF